MDRRSEIENMRRSIAMAPPGTPAVDREQAMALLAELQDVSRRMADLQDGLRRLFDETA